MARILLVEDDQDVLMLFSEVLAEAGHAVDWAETFKGGAELLIRGEYDLLLSDGRLPDGTGIMLADRARAKGIAAVIITGYPLGMLKHGDNIDLREYKVLRKPITTSALLAVVSRETAHLDGTAAHL